jgi:serine protease Do
MNTWDNRSRFGPLPYVFGAIMGVSIGLLIISGVLFFRNSRSSEDRLPGAGTAITPPGSEAVQASLQQSLVEGRRNAIVAATEKVAPAVVSITALSTQIVRRRTFSSPFARDWIERFFGNIPERYKRQYSSLGSGVILSSDGYILTNEHVVHNADNIQVTLSSGETLEGQIVGSAPEYDLTLLKVEANDLPAAVLGDSDVLVVGEWAIAIGSPFGRLLEDTQPTVTVGVISALHRDVKGTASGERILKDMIQTDAAINPGNSGGPLVNELGEVIGINSFIFSSGTGGNLGMGFAIPINRGKWVLDEITRFGRVRDVWVGIVARPVTPELAIALDLQSRRGILINEVEDGSPAERQGLRPGDLIVSVNGNKVTSVREANRIIFGSKVGDTLTLEVDRKGKAKTFVLELKERVAEI